jgi:hypothetical protein
VTATRVDGLRKALPDRFQAVHGLLTALSAGHPYILVSPSFAFFLSIQHPNLYLYPSSSSAFRMADSSSHRLDLRVGGKYRLGKKIGSGSFGALLYALLVV